MLVTHPKGVKDCMGEVNMPGLSESALLVQKALVEKGIETPMLPNKVSREEKKRVLKIICVKSFNFLNWISLMIALKKHRVELLKCTLMKCFQD